MRTTALLIVLWATLLPAIPALAQAPVRPCTIINEYPHQSSTFTQGLFFHDGRLYESSGRYRRSFLAVVDPLTGRHLTRRTLDKHIFAEGIAPYGDTLRLLTWKSGTGFVYSLDELHQVSSFDYRTQGNMNEGWGLTNDGTRFILSDGSDTLRFHEPEEFAFVGTLSVSDGPKRIHRLNELEYVNGMIYANVWKSDRVALIDPATGSVRLWLDLAPLRHHITPNSGVANGIAYDAEGKRLFVTGKYWNKLFEISVPDL